MSQGMWTIIHPGKGEGMDSPSGGFASRSSGSVWAESHSGLVLGKECSS